MFPWRQYLLLDLQPVNWIASTGDRASFICIAFGGPNNTYRWIRTGSVNLQSLTGSGELFFIDTFLQNLTTYIIQNGSILNITSVNATEDGGQYSCVAMNQAGYDEATAMLNVRPIILENPGSQRVAPGMNVTLRCRAESFPVSEYQWEKLNTYTDKFESLAGEIRSVLEFSLVMYEDHGVCRCVVTADMINNITISNNATITGEIIIIIDLMSVLVPSPLQSLLLIV